MNQRKSLKDLTIKDNFMFGAVMLDEENCKGALERVLGMKISHVEVDKEKSIVYHPEYKGVRLDIYAKDEENTRYNVEMQVLSSASLDKRARYYHSQIDMDVLLGGSEYASIPDVYVIFICDFDPFGKKKYRYTRVMHCEEVPELSMEDGSHTIFLNTKGENEDEVPKELVRFLKYVGASLDESNDDYEDAFVEKLQKSVQSIKANREMRERYMNFQELLNEERMKGRTEGISIGERNKLITLVQRKLSMNQSIEQIAEDLMEDIQVISDIVKNQK